MLGSIVADDIEVFGGAHDVSVVTGSLLLAAGELESYEPGWARHRATVSATPSLGAVSPEAAAVLQGPLARLASAASLAGQRLETASHHYQSLVKRLRQVAHNYESTEKKNLAETGMVNLDATFSTVVALFQNATRAERVGLALAYVVVGPGMDPLFSFKDTKKRSAEQVHRAFDFVFPSPGITVGQSSRVDTQGEDLNKLATWTELQGKASQGKGGLVVSQATTRDGETAWVVTVPGTNVSGGSTWGLRRMKQAFNQDSQDVRQAATKALKRAGAQKGDVLYINGHSQGGTHALNLAKDPDLKKDYALKGTVTAGAPRGDDSPPEDIRQIMLIDPDDAVPELGAALALKTSANRVAVFSKTGDRFQPPKPISGFSLGSDHNARNYMNHARKADQTKDPALEDIKRDMGITDLQVVKNTRFETEDAGPWWSFLVPIEPIARGITLDLPGTLPQSTLPRSVLPQSVIPHSVVAPPTP